MYRTRLLPVLTLSAGLAMPALTVHGQETYAPAGRLRMEDVQPLLGQVLGVLQSGRGEQVQRWMDRPVRADDGADGFVQVYNRAVVNARVVRLGTVRFSGRPAGDGLLVDGMVTLQHAGRTPAVKHP